MQARHFDYPPPNGVLALYVFCGVPLFAMALVLANKTRSVGSRVLPQELSAELIVFLLVWISTTIYGVLVANSFPALRLRTNGIEVRFFFPFLTRWIFLSWDQIDRTEAYRSPAGSLFGKAKSDLVVLSDQMPLFYFLPMLVFRRTLKRGFVIKSRIRGYDDLWRALTANCRFRS